MAEIAYLVLLADTCVKHTGVLAVGNYLGSFLAVGILTFILISLHGFKYAKYVDITIDISV